MFSMNAAQQVIGREGETATLLSRFFIKFYVGAGGFAPRQLNRSASSLWEKLKVHIMQNFQLALGFAWLTGRRWKISWLSGSGITRLNLLSYNLPDSLLKLRA